MSMMKLTVIGSSACAKRMMLLLLCYGGIGCISAASDATEPDKLDEFLQALRQFQTPMARYLVDSRFGRHTTQFLKNKANIATAPLNNAFSKLERASSKTGSETSFNKEMATPLPCYRAPVKCLFFLRGGK